jgi:membrane protein
MNNIIKVFKKIYNKDIDFYASSLSFLSIFSLIPILLLVFYIFHSIDMLKETLNQLSYIIILFFPNNYSEEIIKVVRRFFDMNDAMNIVTVSYIFLSSYIFLKDYKVIMSRIGNYTYSFKETIWLYFKLVFFVPLNIILFILVTYLFHINIHIFFIMFFCIFIVYVASIKDVKILYVAQGSIIVTIVLFILKMVFVYYFQYNDVYETLYGSLSFIFFVLLWIYISWSIFLYGVKFIFYQNSNS